MFLSQTETYASMNYRMMSQARYAAEAGRQQGRRTSCSTPTQYAIPGTAADPLSNYDRTKSPVVCTSGCTVINAPVVLSADSSVPSNYPVAAVQTAYNAAAQGTLTAGNATLTYKTHATLMAMQQFVAYGGTQSVVQTWSISSDGAFGNGSKATVEVVATIETPQGRRELVRGICHVRRLRCDPVSRQHDRR